MSSHEIRSSPSSGLRWLTGVLIGGVVFMVFLAGACFVGLTTRELSGTATLYAVVIGALGVFGAVRGLRGVAQLRAAAQPAVIARLDDDGLHVLDGLLPDDLPDDAPENLGWSTYPWSWITSVSWTTLELRKVKALGTDVPLEVLRFTLADDRLPDEGALERPDLRQAGALLRLTPGQARTVLVGEAGRTTFGEALAWIGSRYPAVPVVRGTALPWSTPADDDRWSGSPRVAVVGANGRLGRHVIDALTAREDAPAVAVVRNEAHRALLERAGAEVRMVDLAQGVRPVADALRGCAAVVVAASEHADVVVEAARFAGVQRFVMVADASQGRTVGLAAGSGLSWTVFRPERLTDDAATGEVDLGAGVVPGSVPRADLAQVLVAAIRDEGSVGDVWPITGAPAAR
ncbi:NAD(P)H-binding protein [Nocardioides sp. C4-1]|uniref:NAD(P)H-binding protein n=1 Tax=Nocardioides sp. C4-1 TaxID=3151851 RepID=UPI003264F8C8